MECLAECYNNEEHWSSRRQILSIMAVNVNFKDLLKWIPNLSRYHFTIAKHHLLLHSRGSKASMTGKRKQPYIEIIDFFFFFFFFFFFVPDQRREMKSLSIALQL